MQKFLSLGIAGVALTLSAAIFGFFYAWICSTMWGLDSADPRVAIDAMKAMNASVRNWTFAPAFFGPGPAFLIAAVLARTVGARQAALCFVVAGLFYALFAQLVTMTVNVPMNEALSTTQTPETTREAEAIWTAYSDRWQVFNMIRTATSLISFWVGLAGFVSLSIHLLPGRDRPPTQSPLPLTTV